MTEFDLTPTRSERFLVAKALCESGELIGSEDEIWSHPSAYRALVTWRLCIEAITELIGGGHAVQASFVKACVMQMDELRTSPPFALDDMAEYMVTNTLCRLYWSALVQDQSFPHRCPHCNAAAFVGFLQVDCKARCPSSRPY